MKGHVALQQEIPFQDLGGGMQRRVLSYSEELMSVEVAFEAGAVGAAHTHPMCSAPMCCRDASITASRGTA